MPDRPIHIGRTALRNFKGFKSATDIRLAPLTFLVGPNSSGKSSISDAVLFLAQSGFFPDFEAEFIPRWAGPLVDLGSFQDTVFGHKTSLQIEVGVEICPASYESRKGPSRSIGFSYKFRSSAGDAIGFLREIGIRDCTSEVEFTLGVLRNRELAVKFKLGERVRTIPIGDVFSYRAPSEIAFHVRAYAASRQARLKGKRAGWRRIARSLESRWHWQMWNDTQRVSSGRTAPQRLYTSGQISTTSSRRFYRHRSVFGAVDPDLIEACSGGESARIRRRRRKRLRSSVSQLLEKLNIAKSIETEMLAPSHSSIFLTDNVTEIRSNLIDVGYGASQVIPVLSACIDDAYGPLVVEQPEIHLHPKAQGEVADLLARTSQDR